MSTSSILKNIVPLGLSCFCCAVVLLTASRYGITWDESPYIFSGKSYFQWLLDPSMGTIDKYWSINHEHPPLIKILGGITEYFFNEKLSITDTVSAFRFSTLIWVFSLTYALYVFSSELYGMGIGVMVSLSFFFLPRIFFQSHLAALDYPLTALWFLVVCTFWKGMERGWKWIITAAVLLGFALLVKITALFIYIPLGLCWLIFWHESVKNKLNGKRKSWLKRSYPFILKPLPILIIPPVIFISFWPWLWKNTFERISEYLFFHLNHFKVPMFYFGEHHIVAPWHYPIVLLLFTVPIVVLVPFLVGVTQTHFGGNRNANVSILSNALFPILIASLPGVPKYDGVRLFLPAFPFLCMISGLGLNFLFLKIKGTRFAKAVIGG